MISTKSQEQAINQIFVLFVYLQTIMPFLESEDEMLKILATLTIANIVDEEENKTLITDTGQYCSVWVYSKHYGFHPLLHNNTL